MRTHVVISVWAASCAACWTPQYADHEWQEHSLSHSREASPAPGSAATSLLVGSTEREGDALPRAGDRVLYELDVETPSKSYRRYLRMTVEGFDMVDSDGERIADLTVYRSATVTSTSSNGSIRTKQCKTEVLPVHLELFDDAGQPVGASQVDQAMIGFLASGFHRTCAGYLEHGGDIEDPDERFEFSVLDFPPMFAIAKLVDEDPTLRDLAFDLMDGSLIWTVLWSFGVHLSISPSFELTEPIAREEVTGRPGYRFPLELRVNGEAALRAAATVVEPYAPLGLTAGITRVVGFRANDDRYRFRARWIRPER